MLMRKYVFLISTALALCTVSQRARADVDLELTALIGSGVDTGDADNNPYALQIGGAAELIAFGYVLGARATRSFGTNASGGRNVNDLRTIGADLGYEWQLAILHIGPRLGIGQIRERGDGGFSAPYVEPGAVAEIELGLFVVGADVRYRFAINDSIANGFLVYGKAGLRF